MKKEESVSLSGQSTDSGATGAAASRVAQICATIDPVTRLEGHMKVQVQIAAVSGVQQVVDARCQGMLFRGFERILVGRDPGDAPHITQRICGVCPVAHAQAAVLALDRASGIRVPSNARILRNLVAGANFIDSHILHFYHLSLLDFIEGPGGPPWSNGWALDRRFGTAAERSLAENYVRALEMRRKAHEMGALFGGRLPHPPTFVAGGFTAVPQAEDITAFKGYIQELVGFISGVYLPDVERLADLYPDYQELGRGFANLLAFGAFPVDDSDTQKLLPAGFVAGASSKVETPNVDGITEHVAHSWYEDQTSNLRPSEGRTQTEYPKSEAYSWVKAPRYNGLPCEVGPLARMWIRGDHRRGVSVIDRHRARALEALLIAQSLRQWIEELRIGEPVYAACSSPESASAVGLSEAPRGALGHWLEIASSKISRYQVVTPTCWNCSPRDDEGRLGPLEQALMHTPVKDPARPIEVLRVVHSFDPCLDCAVH